MRYGSSSGTPVWKCFATPYDGCAEKTLFDDAAGFTAGSWLKAIDWATSAAISSVTGPVCESS